MLGSPSHLLNLIQQEIHEVTIKHQTPNDSLHTVVSALYAKILIILGLALPMSEAIADQIHPGKFEGFYLYLFLVSLLFLLFLYVDLLQTRIRQAVHTRRQGQVKHLRDESRKSSQVTSNQQQCDDAMQQCNDAGTSSQDDAKQQCNDAGAISRDNVNSTKPGVHRPVGHYGSFYLRLGTVLFGIGSMIYSGIEIGHILYVGIFVNITNHCKSIITIVRPALQILFVFGQMHFIFLNQTMNIFKHKFVSRMGLMHMLATNLCVWLHVIIEETNHDMEGIRHRHVREANSLNITHDVAQSPGNNSSQGKHLISHLDSQHLDSHLESMDSLDSHHLEHGSSGGATCDNLIMSQLLKDSGPFLFPCTIEFSLISAAILFVMWKNVAEEHQHYKEARERAIIHKQGPLKNQESQNHEGYYSVDCTKANTGLFCGIIIMVGTIISLIIFFVFISNEEESKKAVAVQVASISELVLYGLTTLAVLVGMCQVRSLWYDVTRKLELDNLLLIIAQTGVFIYATFCIIGSFFMLDSSNIVLLIPFLASLATLLQTTLQTIFILDASCRFAYSSEQVRKKPGREVVTFLLVCNLAMWMINTIETNRTDSHPVQNKFYGDNWAWPVITHISMPLAIFYRFHSTVCLFEIWKKSFKYKPQNINYV